MGEKLVKLDATDLDIIKIDPDYADRSHIGEIVRRLPEPGYAGVKKSQVEELIKAIRWDPMQEVKLIKKT